MFPSSRSSSSNTTGSLLRALHLATALCPEQFVLVLCHGARFDPQLQRSLALTLNGCSAVPLDPLLSVLRSVLTEHLHILDLPTARARTAFPTDGALHPAMPLPALCHHGGYWTFGWLMPTRAGVDSADCSLSGAAASAEAASAEAEGTGTANSAAEELGVASAEAEGTGTANAAAEELGVGGAHGAPQGGCSPLPSDRHDVMSFLAGLCCLMPLRADVLQGALHAAGLDMSASVPCRLQDLAALVAALGQAAFPDGVVLRCMEPPSAWLLHQGCCQPCHITRDTPPHGFLLRSAAGRFSSWLQLPRAFAPEWPRQIALSSCCFAFWDASAPFADNANCFFDALGIDRCVLLTYALASAYALPPRLGRLVVTRLLRLFSTTCPVCGLDCQLFVNLLPAWFPHGLLLLHCDGALLHFRSGFPPASVLPEVAWLH